MLGHAGQGTSVHVEGRITWSSLDGVAVVHLIGDFDLGSRHAINECCDAAVIAFGPRVVIDLSNTTFLDAASIAALRAVADRVDAKCGRLCLTGARGAAVREALDLTGAAKALHLSSSIDQAVREVGA